MKDFKELKVWQKAYALSLAVYERSRSFPREEIYGLTSQLRRAAVSVGANIAEGCGRRSDGVRQILANCAWLHIGGGAPLLLARDLKFLTRDEHRDLERKVFEVQRMLTSLVTSIEEGSRSSTRGPRAAKAALGASS